MDGVAQCQGVDKELDGEYCLWVLLNSLLRLPWLLSPCTKHITPITFYRNYLLTPGAAPSCSHYIMGAEIVHHISHYLIRISLFYVSLWQEIWHDEIWVKMSLCSVCVILYPRPRYIPHNLHWLSYRKPGLPVRISQSSCKFSGEMKPGQLTHQLKEAVSKPGHVNNLCYWSVNLKVNSSYKRTLIGWHPIRIVCKAIWSLFAMIWCVTRMTFPLFGWCNTKWCISYILLI